VLPLRAERLAGRLITGIEISTQTRLAYEFVARSPADLPIVALAVAQWPSGRTRVAVGGFGAQPRLALDGQEPSGVEEAVANALSASADQWASADYRLDAGSKLGSRALASLES
jgi:CO/xanthine dehydrogenase FAD-binding subunit